MADNIVLNLGTGGDTLGADQVTTLNGSASSVPKIQRSKVTFGVPGTSTDVSTTNPLPVGSYIGTPAQLAASTPIIAQNYPWQSLRVGIDPCGVFVEAYDTALDTTNKWVLTSGSGGTVPSSATGVLTINAGTAVSGYSRMVTIPAFFLPPQSYLGTAQVVKIDTSVTTNNYRFWGSGTSPTTPTISAPMTDGIGFEITTTGVLNAVVWSNGTKTFTAVLTRPTDGLYHRYSIYYRASRIYWYIDALDVYVATASTATAGYLPPTVSVLPLIQLSVNDPTTAPTVNGVAATAPTFQGQVSNVADYGRNATQISDGIYQFRTASVGKSGGLSVKGASITGTSGSIAAAGTGTIGPVDISEAGNVTFIVKNTVAANAYAGNPVLVFEQSDDNVSWGPFTVTRADTGVSASTFTLVPNTASSSLMFDGAAEGSNWTRVRVTTGPATNAMTVVIQPGGMPFSPAVSVTQQTLTKGVQGPQGVTTQDLKDAGRVNVAITCYQAAGIITTEALFAAAAFSISRDGAAASTGQQVTVTIGKRFSVQNISIDIKNTAAAAGTSKLVLRYSAAGGTITNTSPILGVWDLGSNNAVANNFIGPFVLPFPDGVELLPASTFGFTNLSSAATMLHTITVNGYEY